MPKYIDISAEVSAPDSRHARTAFLDYLSRSGMIQWGERQAARKLIITKRMKPGEIQTDVKLEYGTKEPTKAEELPTPQQLDELNAELRAIGAYEEPYGPGDSSPGTPVPLPQPGPIPEVPQEQPAQDIFGSSPIVEISRRSRGL